MRRAWDMNREFDRTERFVVAKPMNGPGNVRMKPGDPFDHKSINRRRLRYMFANGKIAAAPLDDVDEAATHTVTHIGRGRFAVTDADGNRITDLMDRDAAQAALDDMRAVPV